jgi:hypothetical protein
MTRGYKPVVAIGEAKRKASAWGFVLIAVETETKLPFDFVISDQGCVSLVRVRRLKYAGYGISEIQRLCAQEIGELQGLRVPEEIFRELWVRGAERAWHRYLVLKDTIEALENDEDRQGENNTAGSPDVRQQTAAG